ncbi:hypothetical protein [Listeria aquatica]|nr:hypothetical protein [Listeria aquatica]
MNFEEWLSCILTVDEGTRKIITNPKAIKLIQEQYYKATKIRKVKRIGEK